MFIKPTVVIFAYVLGVTSAAATPIQYDYSSIHPDTFEDFESYPINVLGYSTFQGFSVDFSDATSNSPVVCYDGVYYCPTKSLIEKEETEGARTLLGFSAATTYVGFLLDTFLDNGYSPPRLDRPDLFEITVHGNSGNYTYTLTPTAPQYLGFFDSYGLQSVSITNLGFTSGSSTSMWNYGLDNVVTGIGDIAPIPLPSSAVFLLAALACIAGLSRSKRRMTT